MQTVHALNYCTYGCTSSRFQSQGGECIIHGPLAHAKVEGRERTGHGCKSVVTKVALYLHGQTAYVRRQWDSQWTNQMGYTTVGAWLPGIQGNVSRPHPRAFTLDYKSLVTGLLLLHNYWIWRQRECKEPCSFQRAKCIFQKLWLMLPDPSWL